MQGKASIQSADQGVGAQSDSHRRPGGHAAVVAGQGAALQQRFGRVDVIENQTVAIPGSINTYDLRAQDSRGPFGQPMLSLVSGQLIDTKSERRINSSSSTFSAPRARTVSALT